MRLLLAAEAESLLAFADDFTCEFSCCSATETHRSPTVWLGWAPSNVASSVFSNICLQQSAVKAFSCRWICHLKRPSHELVVADSAAAERHAA